MKSHHVPCTFGCGDTVDTQSKWSYRRITGWATAGQAGGSDIVLRQKLDEFACRSCIEKMKAGLAPGQGSLNV